MTKTHSFSMTYEMDVSLGEAVAAYLDAEHYAFLHSKYIPQYKIEHAGDLKVKITQIWKMGLWRAGQSCICEYVPPACFLNYDLKSVNKWIPSIHWFIRTETELNYYVSEETNLLVSDLKITLTMPWILFPLRHLLEKKLKQLKLEKDLEDLEMIVRRQRLFGRNNLKPYFAKHQFLLHKEAFCSHFEQ